MSPPPSPASSCPFCRITAAHPPVLPTTFLPDTAQSDSLPQGNPSDSASDSHAFLILSTKHVLAFLDIMPLTRGHVLVVPRNHYEKLGEVNVRVSREIGQWLPIISRVVMRTVFGGKKEEEEGEEGAEDQDWHWNVVQNNGVGAAQVVPHVHFHIVPRPPLGAKGSEMSLKFVMFGRGQREDLDEEEAEKLASELRVRLAKEVQRLQDEEGVDLEGREEEDEKKLRGKI